LRAAAEAVIMQSVKGRSQTGGPGGFNNGDRTTTIASKDEHHPDGAGGRGRGGMERGESLGGVKNLLNLTAKSVIGGDDTAKSVIGGDDTAKSVIGGDDTGGKTPTSSSSCLPPISPLRSTNPKKKK